MLSVTDIAGRETLQGRAHVKVVPRIHTGTYPPRYVLSRLKRAQLLMGSQVASRPPPRENSLRHGVSHFENKS